MAQPMGSGIGPGNSYAGQRFPLSLPFIPLRLNIAINQRGAVVVTPAHGPADVNMSAETEAIDINY